MIQRRVYQKMCKPWMRVGVGRCLYEVVGIHGVFHLHVVCLRLIVAEYVERYCTLDDVLGQRKVWLSYIAWLDRQTARMMLKSADVFLGMPVKRIGTFFYDK